ncbi:hypothetical protein TanjilG_04562 [Lupinus angustifolius]|uniref:PB1 domain-containing protein n=1 Tax=Lupinus angustifolius TaxID=3871 RepID=A0A4P1RR80_LUPAN|nr:PREDICTED: uncharacterized protein LOC109342523 [Lupinus angustifolius]OIW16027.1 hypothetical protein TanjilG_04562 [Lupinus angustifolius]
MDPPPPLPLASDSTAEPSAWNDEVLPPVPGGKIRLMCSYGGHIMPRPHDKSLCYIGGDTRIVVVDRISSLKDLTTRLSHTILNGRPFILKYQIPNEDLDNLITVTNDEDLDNMIEEFDRIAESSASPLKPSSSRLRVFLFFNKNEATVSMGSLIDDAKSETWFVDALNNSGILPRVVSESAAVDSFVNLDGLSPSASSNNLEPKFHAQGDRDNKVKVLVDVENSSSNCSSPSMTNLPPNPAPVTMASLAMVTTSDNMNRVVYDDERSDEGASFGFQKLPLPLQLVQPRSGGLCFPSPDSVTSDNSVPSTNSFSKAVYYQEQVQVAQIDNKANSEISDHIPVLQREQNQDPGFTLPPQMDPNQQHHQQQQQQQFVHARTQYIHHPTSQIPMSSYYQVYAQPSQQQYPLYVMPVGPTQPYNMALQSNIADPNVVPLGRTLIPHQSVAATTPYKDNTPPIYPTKSVIPTTYKDASNPAFVQMSSNQFQQQYVGVPQLHHHSPQHIAVVSSVNTSYGYEYGGTVQDQVYYTQQQCTDPLQSQYQSMMPVVAATTALSDASQQFSSDNIQQQTNRTSQMV